MEEFKVVTIYQGTSNGNSFHVHAEGCPDIKKRKYFKSTKYNETITSVEELVTNSYSDMLEESPSDTWEDYLGEFQIFPCVEKLPYHEKGVIKSVKSIEGAIEVLKNKQEESKKVKNYKVGKNQQFVLDQLNIHGEYFKKGPWVWYYHSSTVEVLESLEVRGLVERYTHRETGEDIWILTSNGYSLFQDEIKSTA